ncbi:Averantin oxidoreductase, partial [Diplodia seriata]
VGSQNYTVLRDATAFPDPGNFFPERWLGEEGDELRREAFTPFSVGPRACIGINLAKMELNKLVAAFFLRFNAEVDESMREEDMRMYDLFSAGPSGGKLLIRLAERK